MRALNNAFIENIKIYFRKSVRPIEKNNPRLEIKEKYLAVKNALKR